MHNEKCDPALDAQQRLGGAQSGRGVLEYRLERLPCAEAPLDEAIVIVDLVLHVLLLRLKSGQLRLSVVDLLLLHGTLQLEQILLVC